MTTPMARVGLGSAAFGLDYGVTNSDGIVTPSAVGTILDQAAREGIRVIDTAADYGTAESVIGDRLPPGARFRIVTKFRPGRGDGPGTVRQHLERSLQRLRLPAVHGLMLHHAADLLAPDGGDLFREMTALKEAGLVSKVGFSAYTAADIDAVLSRYSVDIVQVPVNALDQRLSTAGVLRAMKRQGIEVHARSLFLQGLLLADPNTLPACFYAARAPLVGLRQALADIGLSPLQGCLLYGAQNPDIDVMILGVTDSGQLREICTGMRRIADLSFDFGGFALADEAVLNPALWPADIGHLAATKETDHEIH